MNTSIKNTARAAAFVLGGAVALCALHVSAKAEEAVASQRVSYADLDISKPAGARVLYKRIVRAAHQVCDPNAFKTLATARLIDHCIERATSKAVGDVGSPALSALLPSKPLKVASN